MNMNQLRQSFIVPFYNSEQFIRKCLDSVYNQDVLEEYYEVICVNDCSPDGTRDIVLEYQRKHKNLVLIDHEKNKRQGGARNSGMKAAKGRCCWFIDSDDFIEKNCLGTLLKIVETNDLDVLNFDLYEYLDNGEKKAVSISDTCDIMSGAVWLKNLKKNFDENGYPVTKIFKTQFLIDNELYFPEYRFYEDQQFSLFSVYTASKFKHIQNNSYYYVKHAGSTINCRLSAFHYISSIENGTDYLIFFNKVKANDPHFAEKIKMSGLWKINFGCKEIPYFSNAYRKRLIKCIKPHLLLIQQSGYYQGFSKKYFNHFEFYNAVFFVISPLLRLLRNLKRFLKYKLKSIKQV